MEFFDAVSARRSIRRYRETPVEKEKLTALLEAFRLAPSWKNMQCWRIIVVNAAEKDRLLAAVPDSNPGKKGLASAPMALILAANPAESGERDGQAYYLVDCGIALQNLVLAASAHGLGTCWMGIFDEEMVKSAFNIPGQWRVVALTPLGYPDQEPNPRPRKPLTELVFDGTWGRPLQS